MTGKKLWYFVSLCMLAMLPLAGCGGSGGTVSSGTDGYAISAKVTVDEPAGAAKAATGSATVKAIDVETGKELGSAPIVNGSSDLKFTLAGSKANVILLAETAAGVKLRYFLSLDLTELAGLKEVPKLVINSTTTALVEKISFDLGLAGKILGDEGVLAGKTFIEVQDVAGKDGAQVYTASKGLQFIVSLENPLLPAKSIADQTTDSIKNLVLSGTVSKVAIPASGKPIVSFQVTDASGKGVAGLQVANFRPSMIKLVPGANGSPDQWVSYHPKTATDFTRNDSGGTLVNNGDGSYLYYFGASVTDKAGKWAYDPATTNRLAIMVSGKTVTGGSISIINVTNIIYDFVPNGGEVTLKRDIVTKEACLECHTRFTSFHGGGRQDPRYCVACHNNSVLGNQSVVDIALGNGDDTKTRAWATEGISDGVLLGDMVTLIHKVHMGSKLHTKGWNWSGRFFNDYKYPQDIRNCEKCHKGPQADNWKNKPSRQACGSCHDNVNWKTGANTRTKRVTDATKPGYVHEAPFISDDSKCTMCHDAAMIKSQHFLPASADASKRTMSATITGVAVDGTTGNVTATFTVKDGTTPVTDKTKFSAPTFVLDKLVKDANGVFNWVGYTNQYNTKVDKQPILQTKGENDGTLVANADGSFSYTFKLKTAEPEGDIRNVNHAHNVGTPAGSIYNSKTGNAAWLNATPIYYPTGVIAYEPTKTHRIAMTFNKYYATTPITGAEAVNAWFDFVPDGSAVKDTRDIVKMANCASCHANVKLHAAFDIQVCVTCHNPSTKDPATGETVALENIVHKLHMGKNLPFVKAGGSYVINVNHDYSKSAFPGIINKCQTCHVETGNKNGANWRTNATASACITCHDGGSVTAPANAHATTNATQCTVCHSTGNYASPENVHNK